MAIRARALLRKWFGRGMYPTAEQFSDVWDSFLHKEEDKIAITGVDGLAEQLNDKYSKADGEILEGRVTQVETDLDAYIEQTDEAIDQLREEDAAIRRDFAAADAATLQSAKTYTDGRETEIRKDMVAGDATTLAQAKAFTTEREGVLRREQQDGDAATLASANAYTDGRETLIRGDMATGDDTTIQSAKEHTAAREAAIRGDMAAGDGDTLEQGKAYTDTRETAIRKDMAAGDATTLQSAKDHTDARETVVRKDFASADATTLTSAKNYTDQKDTVVRGEFASADAATLQAAKEYVDKAIEQMINGSPAALDTLKELADALGNDPNFAATMTAQIGQKVDKVAGKGLSTEDYTTAEKQKLAGVAAGANNYQHPSSHPATMIAEDATHRFVTDTEKSAWCGKADKTAATTAAAGLMSAADKQKLDGIAAGANNYQHPATHPASMVQQDATHQFITEEERKAWNAKPGGGTATGSSSGLMSAADKQKLDGIAAGANNYVHPSSHPATMISEDTSHRFVSDTEKSTWNSKASTAVATQSANGLMSAADKQKLNEAVIGTNIIAAATALATGQTPTVSWDPATNKFTFGIPKGDKGDSGSDWLMQGDYSLIANSDRSFTLSNYVQRSGDKLWIEFAYLGDAADGHMIGFSQGQSIIINPAETLNTDFYALVTSGGSAKQYTVSFRFRVVGSVLYIYASNEITDGRDIVSQFRIKGIRVLRK